MRGQDVCDAITIVLIWLISLWSLSMIITCIRLWFW